MTLTTPLETSPDNPAASFPPDAVRRDVSIPLDACVALDASVAVVQANAAPVSESSTPERALAPLEIALRVQRANAEQARRVADCLLTFHETLLDALAQPCFALDDQGRVTRWNPALAARSQKPAAQVLGQPLADVFAPPAHAEILRALQTVLNAHAAHPAPAAFTIDGPQRLLNDLDAARLTFVPQYRIPGCFESLVVLIELL